MQDVAAKLGLSSVKDAEAVVAKTIRDGSIAAVIDHEQQALRSREVTDVYVTKEPQQARLRLSFSSCTHTYKIQHICWIASRPRAAASPAHAHSCWSKSCTCTHVSCYAQIASVRAGVHSHDAAAERCVKFTPTRACDLQAFHARTAFCMDIHNDAVKAMRYDTPGDAAAPAKQEATAGLNEALAAALAEDEEDF